MRALSVQNVKEKVFKVFNLTGLWMKVMNKPERNGIWLVYGREKNGKTWFALLLAKMLSTFEKVLYVSGEEGISGPFQKSVDRAKLSIKDKVKFLDYTPFDDVKKKLGRKGYKIVILDNSLVYSDEIKPSDFKTLVTKYPNTLFIILSHEEKGEPGNALGRAAKKWAKVIFRVEGLTAHISGRVPGGIVTVDEEKAMIYWGSSITAA